MYDIFLLAPKYFPYCEVIVYYINMLILTLPADDYQALVDKYANVRNDFESRMVESCKVNNN